MLHDSGSEREMTLGKAERCEPDYEGMVKQTNKQLKKTSVFMNAALAYFTGKTARNKMAELIGELVTEHNMLSRERDGLIVRQEAAKSK